MHGGAGLVGRVDRGVRISKFTCCAPYLQEGFGEIGGPSVPEASDDPVEDHSKMSRLITGAQSNLVVLSPYLLVGDASKVVDRDLEFAPCRTQHKLFCFKGYV